MNMAAKLCHPETLIPEASATAERANLTNGHLKPYILKG